MASVRKRTWGSGAQARQAWVVDHFDPNGKRHIRTFSTKKEAEAFRDDMAAQVRSGTYVHDRESVTVAEAGKLWIDQAKADGLERSTWEHYEQHLNLHIAPFMGQEKLSRLRPASIVKFQEALRSASDKIGPRSPAMIKRVTASLGAIIAEAQRQGLAATNVVRDVPPQMRRGKQAKRHKEKIKVGRDIPTKEEIRTLIDKSEGRLRAFIITAIFTGLRASELRGLAWDDVDLERRTLTVRQRADQWGDIGSPKSEAGRREIPLAPLVVNTLKTWKLQCPRRGKTKGNPGELVLVFPNGAGNPENHANLINRDFDPLQLANSIAVPRLDEKSKPIKDKDGKVVMQTKYAFHALRHAAASLFIEQGFLPKKVQSLMGHASIQMTFDTYGHLFPTPEDDKKAMAEMQARLIG